MQNERSTPPVPRLAATLMLVRPAKGTFEVYLTRRHSKSRFMPDAFVFPGGAVDDDDRTLASAGRVRNAGTAAPELVAAAVRETFEEAGVLLAHAAKSRTRVEFDATTLAALRAQLNGGAKFSGLAAQYDLIVDAEPMAYYSNWITPESEPVRFDAHFFIARAPDDQIAAADAVEVHDGMWLSPADALGCGERNEMLIRFPTMRHLERLAQFDDVDALLAAARTRVVRPVMPVATAAGEVLFDEHAW